MRSFYLLHHKAPKDESVTEKWRGALLSEEASAKLLSVKSAAQALLRYGYEISPHNSAPEHLEEVAERRRAHQERLEARTGWGDVVDGPRGIEEKVHIDSGPPITVVFKPSAYEFTDRARRRLTSEEPAMRPDDPPNSTTE